MPKKKFKKLKIAKSDSDDDDFKIPKKKGHKIAISDSNDNDFPSSKLSTSKGKIPTLIVDHCHFTNISVFEFENRICKSLNL